MSTHLILCTILIFVMYGKHSLIKSFLRPQTRVCLFISNTGSEYSVDFIQRRNEISANQS